MTEHALSACRVSSKSASACHTSHSSIEAILNAALSAVASGINKPVAVLDWLEKTQPQEEYILILDADMIMRRPLDPVRLGVRPGAQPNESGMGVFENPNPNKPLLWRGDRALAHPQEQHPHGNQRRSCAKSLPEMHAVVVLPMRPAHRLLQLSYKGRHGERAGLPGWAVSGFYGYLKGVGNDLALRHVPRIKPRRDTLAGPLGRRGDQARA